MRLLFIIAFISISTALIAQKKGDNTVIVDKAISFSNLKTDLFMDGYMMDGSDTNFITTSAKGINGALLFKFNILRTDSSIIIKGQLKSTIDLNFGSATLKSEFEPVHYVNNPGNDYRKCWEEMNKLALFIGGAVKYIKQ